MPLFSLLPLPTVNDLVTFALVSGHLTYITTASTSVNARHSTNLPVCDIGQVNSVVVNADTASLCCPLHHHILAWPIVLNRISIKSAATFPLNWTESVKMWIIRSLLKNVLYTSLFLHSLRRLFALDFCLWIGLLKKFKRNFYGILGRDRPWDRNR